ncbi:MAG: class I SAM-dependent methyltransferase, partial [Alphaproteobacteria bacterium]
SLGQLLLTSGFSRLACYEDEPVPHGLKSAVRWVLWKMIRAGLRLYIAAESGEPGRNLILSQNLIAVAIK